MVAQIDNDIRREFEKVIRGAYIISEDVGREVEEVLLIGREQPLSNDEAYLLLKKVVTVLRNGARQRGDEKASKALEGDINSIVEQILLASTPTAATSRTAASPAAPAKRLQLLSREGVKVGAVFPRPRFQDREVPMNQGFIRTTDLDLWESNDRLEIHVNQFRKLHGRGPDPQELLDIMLSKLKLPGIIDMPGLSPKEKNDQFVIQTLAKSIAQVGVRTPPIVDLDGTLLDGNRRVAACYYILNSDEFTTGEKSRAEYIFVWQLTEHATDDDRTAVIVSLNFEPPYKEMWPDYVKARKVYEAWRAMIALEARSASDAREREMKRELAKRFALEMKDVTRYIKMMEWANDFEDYFIGQKGNDTYEVQHRANKHFQYFDELSKGVQPGGVGYTLGQDEAYKHLVFDLLYDGKFKNWRQIRELNVVHDNEEAREQLGKARTEADTETAQEHVDYALSVARLRRPEVREVGANTRIEDFVKFLEALPVRAFRDVINERNLHALLRALRLVEKHAQERTGPASED